MRFGSVVRAHLFELLIGTVPLAAAALGYISGKIDFGLAAAVGTFTTIVALSTALLKFEIDQATAQTKSEIGDAAAQIRSEIDRTAAQIIKRSRDGESRAGKIAALVEALDGETRKFGLNHLDNEVIPTLDRIKDGIIPLGENDYFVELHHTMACAGKGWSIHAVSSSSRFRWSDDERQKKYLKANVDAVQRGAELHRVFIVRKSELNSSENERLRQTILDQIDSGISVDLVFRESLTRPEEDDDFVIFEQPDKSHVLFRGEYHFREQSLLLSGQKMTNAAIIETYSKTFHKIHSMLCIERTGLPETLKSNPKH